MALSHVSAEALSDRRIPMSSAILGALGVVYGDIGTSPLYALREAVHAGSHGTAPSDPLVLGVLSLILWTLILVISVKYCLFVLNADNRGEGGILALLALLNVRRARKGTWMASLVVLGLIGAALLYGDGAITPAISVLSALEGLTVYSGHLKHLVVPATVAILAALFLVQHKGTAWIGRIFGPVMLAWFLALGLLGLAGIFDAPEVLLAINPVHAIRLLAQGEPVTLAILAGVFLVATGGEALYADMGHFGRFPIRAAWFSLVLPCLVLNYFGQGALLLAHPEDITNPFYQLVPEALHYPMIALATVATVIASQAIISGAFSMTQQAIHLGFLPRMRVVHTASEERGQIYVPFVNWGLMVVTLAAVIGFGSSSNLAGAYGVAVSLLMVITTILTAVVALRWGWPPVVVYAAGAFFLAIELGFLAANLLKIQHGGWFPLLLALVVTMVMLTWRKGQRLVEQAREHLRIPVNVFVDQFKADPPPFRLPGTAVFMSSATESIPRNLVHFLKHIRLLHEQVFIVSVVTKETPRVAYSERVEVTPITDGIQRIVLRFGFMETPDVPWALIVGEVAGKCPDIDPGEVTYFVGQETIIANERVPGMSHWRELLFAFMSRNAELSASYFYLPPTQVIGIGISLEI